MPSSPFMYSGHNHPPVGPTHGQLLDSAQGEYERILPSQDNFSPFRAFDCWLVNYATDAQIAAWAFWMWNYNVHNGGISQFYSNTHGYGFYLIEAMIRVTRSHASDPVAQELLSILSDAVDSTSDASDDDRDEDWPDSLRFNAKTEFEKAATSYRGRRISLSQELYVANDDLNRRYYAMDDLVLIDRMETWLADFIKVPLSPVQRIEALFTCDVDCLTCVQMARRAIERGEPYEVILTTLRVDADKIRMISPALYSLIN